MAPFIPVADLLNPNRGGIGEGGVVVASSS